MAVFFLGLVVIFREVWENISENTFGKPWLLFNQRKPAKDFGLDKNVQHFFLPISEVINICGQIKPPLYIAFDTIAYTVPQGIKGIRGCLLL